MGTRQRPSESNARPVWWRSRMVVLLGVIGLVTPLGLLGGATSASATTTYPVTATVTVGNEPQGTAVNATTNTVYVANFNDDTVSVINGTTNTVMATVRVGNEPQGVAVNAETNIVYVANF